MMMQKVNKAAEPTPKVHPGLAKEAWDEVLVRSGIDPNTMTEYNVPNESAEDELPSQK